MTSRPGEGTPIPVHESVVSKMGEGGGGVGIAHLLPNPFPAAFYPFSLPHTNPSALPTTPLVDVSRHQWMLGSTRTLVVKDNKVAS